MKGESIILDFVKSDGWGNYFTMRGLHSADEPPDLISFPHGTFTRFKFQTDDILTLTLVDMTWIRKGKP